MNALILSTMLAGQCPGGVCPVPAQFNSPYQFTAHAAPVVVYQTVPPPLAIAYGPVRGFTAERRAVPFMDRGPLRRGLQYGGPIRNTVRRLFR